MLSMASALFVVVFASPAVFPPDAVSVHEPTLWNVAIAPAAPEPAHVTGADATPAVPPDAAWLRSRPQRPAPLPAMYATLGGLQVLDAVSTYRIVQRGGTELNPVVEGAAGNAAAMLAVKALATAGTIYFTERAWKKHRRGAVILMAVVNGVAAAVVVHNLKKLP